MSDRSDHVVEPGDKQPAPGGLRLVQAFVNTNDLEDGRDELDSTQALQAWLDLHGLLTGAETLMPDDLQKALEVREALRALAFANNGQETNLEAAQVLNRASGGSRLVIRFGQDGTSRLEPAAAGVNGALGRLLAHVYTAMVEGTWPRMKACRNDTCRWIFYDRSKNRSGAWCTMAECGDKLKARAYRQRRKAAT
jgi:predicted RNA-binding Zn ribbon-like protein